MSKKEATFMENEHLTKVILQGNLVTIQTQLRKSEIRQVVLTVNQLKRLKLAFEQLGL